MFAQQQKNSLKSLYLVISVLRILDVYPGSDIFHPGSKVDKIPDPYPHQWIEVFFTKIWSWVLKNKIWDVHPGSRILALDFLPSRIPYPGVKNHRIPDPGSATVRNIHPNTRKSGDTKVKFMLKILEKIHVGSETGSGLGKKIIRIHNTGTKQWENLLASKMDIYFSSAGGN